MRNPTRRVPPDVDARFVLPGEQRAGAARSGPVVTGVTVNRYPPELYPIPEARSFALFDTADMTGAGATATPAGLVLQLTDGYSAVIRSITIDLNDITVATNVRYTIRVGGASVPGYDQLRHFPRNASSVSRDFDAFIVVEDGRKIDALFTNVDGGAYKVGLSMTGWIWPTAAGRRWIGE